MRSWGHSLVAAHIRCRSRSESRGSIWIQINQCNELHSASASVCFSSTMFIEANKYNVPCPYKAALGRSAASRLADCEPRDFTQWENEPCEPAADREGLSLQAIFLFTDHNKPEKPSLIENFYKSLHSVVDRKAEDTQSVSLNRRCLVVFSLGQKSNNNKNKPNKQTKQTQHCELRCVCRICVDGTRALFLTNTR